MQYRALEIDDPRWAAILDSARHDVEHLPQYLAELDRLHETQTRIHVVEDDHGAVAIPLSFRALGAGYFDASSPSTRSNPVFRGGTPEWRVTAVRSLLDQLQDSGVVSLFLRLHPLLDSGAEVFSRFGAIVGHGPSYVVPLERPLDEIRRSLRRNHRRGLRTAAAMGATVERDGEWEHLEEFHRIYLATMDRVHATSEYRFPLEHFERLRDSLSPYVSLFVLKLDGELIGGHLVTECDAIIQSLYGAVHPDHYHQVPQIALYDAVLEWGQKRGNLQYFMDGGAQVSLRSFKEGITPIRPTVATARIVVDPVEYGRSCSRWVHEQGQTLERLDAFFPPYRRPTEVSYGASDLATRA